MRAQLDLNLALIWVLIAKLGGRVEISYDELAAVQRLQVASQRKGSGVRARVLNGVEADGKERMGNLVALLVQRCGGQAIARDTELRLLRGAFFLLGQTRQGWVFTTAPLAAN